MLLILYMIFLFSLGDATHLPMGSSIKPLAKPGVAQPEAKPGVAQPEANAGVTQPEAKPGVAQPEANAGVAQPEAKRGVAQPEAKPEVAQPEAKPGVAQPEAKPGVAQPEAKPGVAPPEAKPGVAQPEAKPGVAQPEAKPEVAQPEAKPGVGQLEAKPRVLQTKAPHIDVQPVVPQKAVNETVKDTSSAMYAFSAFLTSITTVLADGNIVFDGVLTNVGGLYFNTSGQFVCPDDGIYVFSWSIMKTTRTPEDMQCITALRQAGVDEKYGPKTSYYSTTYSGMTSMTSVVQCTLGTAVTVVSKPWSETIPGATFHGSSTSQTSFSGFKLQSSIAFTVELSKDLYAFDGGRIMFDDVLCDFGGHFDVIPGGFYCPDDGIYVFSLSAHTSDPTTPWSVSRLMKDGKVVVLGPITYRATSTHDSGSNSISTVVQCEAGKSIYIETQSAHDFIYNSYTSKLTSFTGFKLFNGSDPTAVAFTAVLDRNHTANAGGLPLPMEQVIINIGGAYDPMQSAFACPDDAYYVFTYSFTANSGGPNPHIDLYMDTSLVARLFPTDQTSDDATGTTGTASTSVIVQCTPESLFQLKVTTATESVYLAGYTHFSGYKVPGIY